MAQITINGTQIDFEPGASVLQLATDHGIEIPHYCYHDSLSAPANCRICLAEIWQPNPRHDNKLEYLGKLVPTCTTPAADGMVVSTNTPHAIANQKAVMELLLVNHPVDCPVCDQAGECHLQDYSYQYGRGQSRFQEDKNKQPKKDVGPNVLLYSDRCIMCTRCVRFTREVTGTSELMVDGRGSHNQIDVFPGLALDNELSANVIDLCPVGALLDKDFLFQQRVWFLKKTPSIDGITASGDNIYIEHNEGEIYRIKPRRNDSINQWWITDEVRYGWKFIHSEHRCTMPSVEGEAPFLEEQAPAAWSIAVAETDRIVTEAVEAGGRLAVMVSPMLTCEDAFLLGEWARSMDAKVVFGVGPVPIDGEAKTFPGGYTICNEKAPNARGVRRVLAATGNTVLESPAFFEQVASGVGCLVLTGNYPSDWVTDQMIASIGSTPLVMLDTLPNRLTEAASVVLPATTWAEKAGTFENVNGRLQSFERAISSVDYCKGEAQIALELIAHRSGRAPAIFVASEVRARMAAQAGLEPFADTELPSESTTQVESDLQLVDL
ncbi:MAG: ferredoxin [Planctomycetaceae bacterium]|nr:ferredoxin [Planctomycetaceae bacterium]